MFQNIEFPDGSGIIMARKAVFFSLSLFAVVQLASIISSNIRKLLNGNKEPYEFTVAARTFCRGIISKSRPGIFDLFSFRKPNLVG